MSDPKQVRERIARWQWAERMADEAYAQGGDYPYTERSGLGTG